MSYLLRSLAGAAATAAVVGSSFLCASPASATESWGDSLQDAEVRSSQSGKLVLLELQADYCKWCKMQDRTSHLDSRFVLLSDEFALCRLDGEKEGKPQVKDYRVDMYPALVFVDSGGRLVGKATGYQNPDAYLSRMVGFLPESVVVRLKAAPANDIISAAKLVVIEAGRGRIDDAASLMPRLDRATNDPADRIAVTAANHALGTAYVAASQYASAGPCFEKVAALAASPDELGQAHTALKQLERRLRDRRQASRPPG